MTDAATIAKVLGGVRAGDGFACHCPVPSHGKGRGDKRPSLSVRDGDGTLLVHCHAGCDVRDVFDALRHRRLLDDDRPLRASPPQRARLARPDDHKPDAAALVIWHAGVPVVGSIAATYLQHRGISIAPPPSLRFDAVSRKLIVAVQRPDGKVVAVQTTQLSAAGTKAAVTPCRITTGALGAAAARFAKATDMLGLAEGTETALAAMQLTGLPCWASLGAGRMHRICVPSTVRELHVFADADEPGRVAAERTADAHTKAGRRVVFRFPPQGSKDFADLLAKVAA